MAEIALPQQAVPATHADIVPQDINGDDTADLSTSSPDISPDTMADTEALDLGGRLLSEDQIKEMIAFNTAIRCSAHLQPGLFSWGLEVQTAVLLSCVFNIHSPKQVEVPGLRKKLKLEVDGRLFFVWWQRQFLR